MLWGEIEGPNVAGSKFARPRPTTLLAAQVLAIRADSTLAKALMALYELWDKVGGSLTCM